MSKNYYVLVAVVLLLLQVPVLARTFTLEEFLSDTVIGKSRDALSEAYGLEFDPRYEYHGAIRIGELQYGKLDFDVQIYVDEKECTTFSLWCSQFRGSRNGKTMHGDPVEIDDVLRELLKDLEGRYGKAPPLKLHETSEEGSNDLSYMWVNQEYVLVLSEHDSTITKGVSLTHCRRNPGTGEFIGTPEEHRLLQENSSGKLPDTWPCAVVVPEQVEQSHLKKDGMITPTPKLKNRGIQSLPEANVHVADNNKRSVNCILWIMAGIAFILFGVLWVRIARLKRR